MEEAIEFSGIKTNNLKDIDVAFPLGQYTVVTGVSGSGKSSLVFETLYGEAYRRFVASLSSFARQYLKALPKPDVDDVKNLPPAIAVQQNRAGLNSRSTVGTLTEMIDVIRILYSHLAVPHCPKGHGPIRPHHIESILGEAEQKYADQTILITAPLRGWQKMKPKDLKEQLESQGFTRLLIDDKVTRLEEAALKDLAKGAIVIDRLRVIDDELPRLSDSIALGVKVGRGFLMIVPEKGERSHYCTQSICAQCETEVPPLSGPAYLNFNHPLGACPHCQGFGREPVMDLKKIIPDEDESLASQGVACWNFGEHDAYYGWAKKSAKVNKIDFNKPFASYTDQEWTWLREGTDKDDFHGLKGYFAYLDSKKYKPHYRIHAARFRRYESCSVCHGRRLRPESLRYYLNEKNIADVSDLSVEGLHIWLQELRAQLIAQRYVTQNSSQSYGMGLQEAMEDVEARVSYLMRMGLSYLSVGRTARTLSGGELQRINMARCLGSALTGTLFCLDEPSVGLHPRDTKNLFGVIQDIKEQGNTVVVVEHERSLIQGADHLIEIGPDAGHRGGTVVYQGAAKNTSTERWPWVPAEKFNADRFIELKGARTNNLQNVTMRFPSGSLTVVCGVSGSGKTSLIQHTLYPFLASALGQKIDDGEVNPQATGVGPLKTIQRHREVVLVSQQGIGRSSRSNIATYLGLMNDIRQVFAGTPQALAQGLTASSFSFNVPGGRCESCKGLGTVVEDLSFLGEMAVVCPECQGRRFDDSVLRVTYKGRNLLEVMNMTALEAREFFFDKTALVKVLDSIIALGLGYVTLAQPTSSFSGGEAQRLKLLDILKDTKDSRPCILIFDEPTTGLSDRDVKVFLEQIRALTNRGHTVLVVEHHVGMIRSADWVVEVGPEAAHRGGRVVFQGPPRELADQPESVTAPFLKG